MHEQGGLVPGTHSQSDKESQPLEPYPRACVPAEIVDLLQGETEPHPLPCPGEPRVEPIEGKTCTCQIAAQHSLRREPDGRIEEAVALGPLPGRQVGGGDRVGQKPRLWLFRPVIEGGGARILPARIDALIS